MFSRSTRERRGTRAVAFAAAALIAPTTLNAGAATDAGAPARERPRVALALSGGGARGIAHIGALRALDEAGIPVDAIAATSMGAVVGGIFATGRTPAELEHIVRSLDWASLFSGRPDRRTLPVDKRVDRYMSVAGVGFDWKALRLPEGVLAEHRVNRFLVEHLAPAGYAANDDFDRLAIPFRAVAGDLATGEPVVLAKGDLARAVRASMAIPLVFPPVEWEGRRLVDGMIADNLPVDVARSFGAAVVIAVDIGTPDSGARADLSALGVASRVTELLMRQRYLDFAASADVLVRPDLGDHSATDYAGFDELIRRGHAAVDEALPAIRSKLAEAGVAGLERRPRAAPGRPLEGTPIAGVSVRGNERVGDRLVRRTFNIPVGPGFDMTKGLHAYDKIDASHLFERTWLEFEPTDGGVEVVLRVKDASPNRAEVGFGYTEWERARGSIRLRNQNTFGFGEKVELLLAASDAERVLEASLSGDRLLVAGFGYRIAGYTNLDKPRFFDGAGEEINRGRFQRDGVDLLLRTERERRVLLEGGARFGRVKTTARGGLEAIAPPATDQVGAVFGRIVLDGLDDLRWPEHGARLALAGEWSSAGLGAEREYWLAGLELRAARQLGERVTLQGDLALSLSGDDLPVYDWYRLGGEVLVPGYRREELKGAQAMAFAASMRVRVLGQLRALVRGGAGNVFATTDQIGFDQLRWGVATGFYHPSPIGPVSIEFAVHDGGETLTTLSVGWP